MTTNTTYSAPMTVCACWHAPKPSHPSGQCEPTTHIMAKILEVVETILEKIKDTPLERLPERTRQAGSLWSEANDTTSIAAAADEESAAGFLHLSLWALLVRSDATAVPKVAGEARPLGFAQYKATTESDLAEHPVEGNVAPSWAGANGMTSAAATAVAKPADEARPPGPTEYSATTEIELAVSSDGNGPSPFRANGTTCATVAKSPDDARPPRTKKYSAKTAKLVHAVRTGYEPGAPIN